MARGNTRWTRTADRLVFVLDQNLRTQEYLGTIFRLEGFQVGYARSVDEYLKATAGRTPNIALMNADFDGGKGLELLRLIRSKHLGTAVIVLQENDATRPTVEAMTAGAYDVFSAPFDTEMIVESAFNSLDTGIMVVNGRYGAKHLHVRNFGALTPRECDVLDQLVGGLTNKEAGRALGISPRTVEVHRSRVMEKLGAKNTADLLRIVLVQ